MVSNKTLSVASSKEDLKEVQSHISLLSARLDEELSTIDDELADSHKWADLISRMNKTFIDKGIDSGIPASVMSFIGERPNELMKKRDYVRECIRIVKSYDVIEQYTDISKVAEMSSSLIAIAKSLGFLKGVFARQWNDEEDACAVFIAKGYSKIDDASEALEFLRKAHKEGRLSEIQNMEQVLDALDISQDLEFARSALSDNHINI